MANEQNLLKGDDRHKFTLEESSKGGYASGKARRERRMMKDILLDLLKEKGQNGKTYGELATLGLIKGAMKGNARNYQLMLEVLGELLIVREDVETQ